MRYIVARNLVVKHSLKLEEMAQDSGLEGLKEAEKDLISSNQSILPKCLIKVEESPE
jgi:hypothetical protein